MLFPVSISTGTSPVCLQIYPTAGRWFYVYGNILATWLLIGLIFAAWNGVFSLENIHEVAKAFRKVAGEEKVIAFHGEMGAGKTTFIHALCDVKGVRDVVSSPTFPIINEYNYDCEGTKRVIFHIDLYRLRDAEEARQAGVEECLNSGYCCLVEWPDRAPSLFPDGTLHAWLELVDDKFRLLKIGQN